jgi:hypothetical protein
MTDPSSDAVRPSAESFARLEADRLRLPEGFSTGPGGWSALRFAAGQRLFGLGGGDAAPVLAWYRRFVWAELRRRSGTARAALWVLREPLRLARGVREAAAHAGGPVRERHGVSVAAQVAQMLWLGLVRNVQPDSYYRFQLFRPERRRRAALYLQHTEAAMLYRVLAHRDARDDFLTLEDKRRFELWCRRHALPTVRTVAEFRDGALVDTELAPGGRGALAAHRGRDLFSKPVDASEGRGARRWHWQEGGWTDGASSPLDEDALVAELAAQSRGTGVLVQECLANDPLLGAVAPAAVSTVRFVTARSPGGAPEITNVGFRMGVGASRTDNFSGGGLAAAVDPATGRLGAVVQADPVLHVVPVEIHPDTGTRLAGFQLPHWPQAVALALASHAALERIGFVGWDVALTPDGPVLVEGNFSPGARLAQAPSGEPLGATNHLRHLDAQLARSYARGR